MSVELIIEKLATIIEGVSGIDSDNVHRYIRFSFTPQSMLDMFRNKSTHIINTWQLTRKSTEEIRDAWNGPNLDDLVTHTIIITGSYGVKDSDQTAITFQTLIETVCAAIRSKPDLDDTVQECDPPQVLDVSYEFVGKALTHNCILSIKVREYINFNVT